MAKWGYTIQLRSNDQRRYWKEGKSSLRVGVCWELTRSRAEGGEYHQSIVASSEVFGTDEEAMRDALEKLSILACPIEQPVAQVLRWMHEDL